MYKDIQKYIDKWWIRLCKNNSNNWYYHESFKTRPPEASPELFWNLFKENYQRYEEYLFHVVYFGVWSYGVKYLNKLNKARGDDIDKYTKIINEQHLLHFNPDDIIKILGGHELLLIKSMFMTMEKDK